ncbi:keto-deoxy-phosphogluconate aldolase [Alsobacter soli]|uniref:2-dehydro-3-deoxy-phosphogluconate aldolase n=1 Tax=Alsobacter soli TaxID=2109933 RepID=A0A2T1HRF5_9HYPH|nr:bifunctional 4-hydroxy-2-oxoglutarate aldolase/2-dehydro-3-deoxy-phosphogluconate aldolase [Alsobacter soli]PSC04244.1 keto-deoxy-phosphogluconate aldolase [Alsobacter soli]
MHPERALEQLGQCRIVPVVTVPTTEAGVELGRRSFAMGLRAIEVTLRTDAAAATISALREACPELLVGAGSVLTEADLRAARDAGAQFTVSPGLDWSVLKAAAEAGVLHVPGVATPSEMLGAQAAGAQLLKLFPAETLNGRSLLAAVAGPMPKLRFFPTGGIRQDIAADYLGLPNVACIGGSWIASNADLRAGAWASVEARLAEAARLASRH